MPKKRIFKNAHKPHESTSVSNTGSFSAFCAQPTISLAMLVFGLVALVLSILEFTSALG